MAQLAAGWIARYPVEGLAALSVLIAVLAIRTAFAMYRIRKEVI